MKIFNDNRNGYSESVNFVDDNNVVVGFDYSQSCCEQFDYLFISKKTKNNLFNSQNDSITNLRSEFTTEQLEPYDFDKNFFEQMNHYCDEGGCVSFRLSHKANKRDKIYLVLYNYHNGYYGHGFSMKVNEKMIQNGTL